MKKIKYYLSKEIVRFALGGIAGAAAGFVTLTILTECFDIWYFHSSNISYVVNYAVSFFIQKYWTFKNREENKMALQLVLYVVSAITYFFANAGMMYFFVNWYHVPYLLAYGITLAVISAASFYSTRAILKVKASHA